ncbi:TetR/AcrR family transcriptional regulator [Streptomyces netropsis]|uniref:TetR/AcrR family transcriptional regulator n=1 Tax=Streptomyces netropsis TaxID=55404 RepID=UPI0037B3023F
MTSGKRAGSTRASVWLAAEPAPKRKAEPAERKQGEGQEPKPGALDRRRIVEATVRLLDADGLAKFSMRRLADELDVTAMSVYWYVDSKDDLLEFALDQVSGEMVVPDPAAGAADWRDQLRALAVEYRNMLVAHPWVPVLLGRYLNIGPRSMAFSDAILAVMGRSGVPKEGMTGALSAVFQFVYGFSAIEGQFRERCRGTGLTEDEYYRQVVASVSERPDFAEEHSEALAMSKDLTEMTLAEARERDFDFALDTVIAGIEVMRDRAGAVRDRAGAVPDRAAAGRS